jgi:hypothetical protein
MITKQKESLLRGARKEFMERYHRWAFKDAQREVAEDFRFVRRVKSQTAYRFIEMVEPMSKAEQLRLMRALVKRFHGVGFAHVPETITSEDQRLIKRYLEYDHGEIIPGLRVRLPIIRDGKHKRMRLEAEGFKLAKINRQALHRAIANRLGSVCGQTLKSYSSGESYFETPIGPWIMRTEFGTTSRVGHFSYFHRLMTPGEMIIGEGMALLHWLGITGQTAWVLEDESQVKEGLAAVSDICAHFLREAAQFLDGFKPPTS